MTRWVGFIISTVLLLGLSDNVANAQFKIQFGGGNQQGNNNHNNNPWWNNQQGNHNQNPWWGNDHNHKQVIKFNDKFSIGFYVEDGKHYYRPYHRHRVSQPVLIEPGSFSHVDELAQRLEYEINLLCLDMHDNYAHNPGHRETYRETYQMLTLAREIHASEHQHDRVTLAAKVRELDPLFHHVEEDIRHWTRHAHRQWGEGGLQTKMASVEALIHHLLYDVGAEAPPPGPAAAEPVAPPPVVEER